MFFVIMMYCVQVNNKCAALVCSVQTESTGIVNHNSGFTPGGQL